MANITITTEQAASNFESLASLLIESAPSQKAIDFAHKVLNQARARGAEWLAENAVDLQLLDDHKNDFCPVSDNRGFFMAKFQMALLK